MVDPSMPNPGWHAKIWEPKVTRRPSRLVSMVALTKLTPSLSARPNKIAWNKHGLSFCCRCDKMPDTNMAFKNVERMTPDGLAG